MPLMSRARGALCGRTCLRALGFAALGVVLAACSSRPQPALRTAGTMAQPAVAASVDILAVTTRRPSEDEGLRFSGERASAPQLARVVVSIPRDRQSGQIQWPPGPDADPSQAFVATRFETLEPKAFASRLRDGLNRNRRQHVLVFVHGYNTRFDEAAFRFAQIVHDSGTDVTPILFSWASWASVASYPYDRESAALARDALEGLLQQLSEAPHVGQISVLAHSMGSWLTLESLRQMVIRRQTIPTKLTDVMLAAPDVDIDVAMAQGRVLRTARHKPKLTLFVSSDDKALGASRWLWGSKDRLGAINPMAEPYRSSLARSGVSVIDLSAVAGNDSLNHGKFAESPEIVRLIGRRLSSDQTFDSAAATVNPLHTIVRGATTAVETVLTAPLRIGETAAPGGSLATGRE